MAKPPPPDPASEVAWSPASGRKELEACLRRLGGQADAEIELAEAALWLAALDRPRVGLERYHHHLSLLARDTAELALERGTGDSLAGRAAALNAAIRERHGYRGDRRTYDDLQNANLMRVIDRRKGLPVALGILYIHAARAQGWTIEGLNFPGHFLLRLESGAERAILDPFEAGALRDARELRDILRRVAGPEAELRPEHTAAVSNRGILLRLRNNIKQRLLLEQKTQDALAVLESMLMVAPDQAAHWLEAGLLNAQLGNLRAAVMALENVLELDASSGEMHQAAQLLQSLKTRIN